MESPSPPASASSTQGSLLSATQGGPRFYRLFEVKVCHQAVGHSQRGLRATCGCASFHATRLKTFKGGFACPHSHAVDLKGAHGNLATPSASLLLLFPTFHRRRQGARGLASILNKFLPRQEATKKHIVAESSVAPPRKRGGGGAWRAFIHMSCKNHRFQASDMQRLREEYWALSAEDYSYFKAMGRQATQSHSHGVGAFPALSRRTRRHRPEAQADQEATVQRNERSQRLSTEFTALAQAGEGVSAQLLTAGDMDFYIKTLAAHAAQTKLDKAKQELATEQVIVENSQVQIEELLSQRQLLRDLHCNWHATSLTDTCPALVAVFGPESMRGVAAPASIEQEAKDWENRHVQIEQASWPQPAQQKLQEQPLCWRQGFCSCRGKGRQLRKIHGALKRAIKNICLDPAVTTKIQEGHLLIHWQSARRQQGAGMKPGPSATSAAEGPGTQPALPTPHIQENYFTFVPIYYLKPWRPTFALFQLPDGREMAALPTLRLQEQGLLQGSYHFRCCTTQAGHPHFIGVWEFLDQLNLQSNWYIKLWWASDKTQPTHQRLRLHASPASYPSVLVWDGDDRKRRPPIHELCGAPPKRPCRDMSAQLAHDGERDADANHSDRSQSDDRSQDVDTDGEGEPRQASGNNPENHTLAVGDADEAEDPAGILERALELLAAEVQELRDEQRQQQTAGSSSSSSSTTSSSSSSSTTSSASRESSLGANSPRPNNLENIAVGEPSGSQAAGQRRGHAPTTHSWGFFLRGRILSKVAACLATPHCCVSPSTFFFQGRAVEIPDSYVEEVQTRKKPAHNANSLLPLSDLTWPTKVCSVLHRSGEAQQAFKTDGKYLVLIRGIQGGPNLHCVLEP